MNRSRYQTISKKATALLLSALTLLSLAACSAPTNGGQTAAAPAAESAAEPAGDAAALSAASGVPDRGKQDRSDLAYAEAIDGDKKDDWTADWIWTKYAIEDSYTVFRKTFTLEAPQEATAYISSADKYVLWVNGELLVLDGCLKRGPTPYDSYYDTIPVTNLQAGENTIALLIAFNGRSGDSSIVPTMLNEDGDEVTQAGLLFEMAVGDQVIRSDESWKAARHEAYRNKRSAGKDYPGYSLASQLAECNVYYDAREDMGPFYEPSFDDSAWENAFLIAKAGDLPFGELYDGGTEPVLFGEMTDFADAADCLGRELTEDTVLTLSLPANSQFGFGFELTAPAGKKLTIYTDTYRFQDGLPSFKDTYVTAEGAQSYEHYPWRSGTKLIIEAEAGITFTRISYRLSRYNTTLTAPFTSDNAALDQLWKEGQNTVLLCMRDSFMDCPERERGPYMGDASNEADAALYAFGEGGAAMIRKAILNSIAWTRTDNAIPSRAPSIKPQEIPNQSLAFLTAACRYYEHTGDRETMTSYYRAALEYLKLYTMTDGLPDYREGSWSWDDWGNKIDKPLLQTGFYFYALRLTKELGESLGISEGADFLQERMDSIRANYRARYYTEAGFQTPGCAYIDERGNALMVLSGLAGEEDYELVASIIQNTREASPFCEKYILEAACLMGRQDIALGRILTRYAPQLTDEYDTLWENYWTDDGTVNHGWAAAPTFILSRYVAGIRPTEPGFAAYEIAPWSGMKNLTCETWTPLGTLSLSVVTDEGGTTITVNAIAAEGTIRIPEAYGTVVSAEGAGAAVDGNTVTVHEAGTVTIVVR